MSFERSTVPGLSVNRAGLRTHDSQALTIQTVGPRRLSRSGGEKNGDKMPGHRYAFMPAAADAAMTATVQPEDW